MKELKDKLEELEKRLAAVEKKTDREALQREIRELEAETMKSDFWADVKNAQSVMQQVSDRRGELTSFEKLEEGISTLKQLLSLSSEDSNDLDIAGELSKIENDLTEAENRLFLSGKFDPGAAFLSIHAGQGGVEAMDWAAMLARMYTRYAEKKNWTISLVDESTGEEAGIKSATLEIKGHYAYGFLKKESGTHRLVRQSPFNADALRQTSFALVEVLPVIDNKNEINLDEADLEWDMYKSSGPGGQNVQKVATAVRVKHLPTGITVTAQSERSQHQNKENALKVLTAKLYQLEEVKRAENEKEMKNWSPTASWGTQIRSYVLHPYKLVKDVRTDVEVGDAEAVLNGNLDIFIEAGIRL